jgi:uncharacterized protein
MATAGFENLLSFAGKLENRKLPPVDQWNPAFCGDIDIRIARDGNWLHEGRPFLRQPLVRLLSSILKREGDEYFLVSPVEKMHIQVEDVPFVAVGMTQEEGEHGSSPTLVFRTLTDDVIRLDREHLMRVETDPVSGEPRPYIQVRGGMEARIHRPVFYELVGLGREVIRQGVPHLIVESACLQFDLGRL